MLDVLITGGSVIDGTGAPARAADVAVRDGRIVAIAEPGTTTEDAATTIDATGLLVTPGIVDPHTHYDAQLFWDPFATPSNTHGITSMIAGNCGFTLAPLRPQDADYTRRMMSKVRTADVVVTNPTHYAVALAYDRTGGGAPVVVAKGADFLASRIREEAARHDVPVIPNPPLARALYKVDLDCEIPGESFREAAVVIAYVWKLKNRAGAVG